MAQGLAVTGRCTRLGWGARGLKDPERRSPAPLAQGGGCGRILGHRKGVACAGAQGAG